MILFDVFLVFAGIYLVYLIMFRLPRKRSYDEYVSRKLERQRKQVEKSLDDFLKEPFK
jgi:hypothetical protein